MDTNYSKSSSYEQGQSSQSDVTSKRNTLIFLGALGITLLVTGATGTRMIRSISPASSNSATMKNKRSKSRLKELLTSSTSSEPIDFRTNYTFSRSLFATPILDPHIPTPSTSHLRKTSPTETPDLADNAVLDALKALGIATALVFGSTGFGIFILAKKFGASDLESFMNGLETQMLRPFTDRVRPGIAGWVKQKNLSEDDKVQVKKEEAELQDWIDRGGWREIPDKTTEQNESRGGG